MPDPFLTCVGLNCDRSVRAAWPLCAVCARRVERQRPRGQRNRHPIGPDWLAKITTAAHVRGPLVARVLAAVVCELPARGIYAGGVEDLQLFERTRERMAGLHGADYGPRVEPWREQLRQLYGDLETNWRPEEIAVAMIRTSTGCSGYEPLLLAAAAELRQTIEPNDRRP